MEITLVLLLAGAGLWIFHDGVVRGRTAVAVQATRDSLVKVQHDSKVVAAQRDSLRLDLVNASMHSAVTRSRYVKAEQAVALHGDTALTKDSSQVLLPEVAADLRSARDHIASLEAENAKLKFALKTDTLYIATLDQQIRLQANINKMVENHSKCGRKCGIIIGTLATLVSIEAASQLH